MPLLSSTAAPEPVDAVTSSLSTRSPEPRYWSLTPDSFSSWKPVTLSTSTLTETDPPLLALVAVVESAVNCLTTDRASSDLPLTSTTYPLPD